MRGMYLVFWEISLAKGLNMRAALFGFKFLLGGGETDCASSLSVSYLLYDCVSIIDWLGCPHWRSRSRKLVLLFPPVYLRMRILGDTLL